jgi:hypothetical protein
MRANREGEITMQTIIDRGENDPLDYRPTDTDQAIARQIRPHLPGNRADDPAVVLRSIRDLETYNAWRKTELSDDDDITRAIDVLTRFARDRQAVQA